MADATALRPEPDETGAARPADAPVAEQFATLDALIEALTWLERPLRVTFWSDAQGEMAAAEYRPADLDALKHTLHRAIEREQARSARPRNGGDVLAADLVQCALSTPAYEQGAETRMIVAMAAELLRLRECCAAISGAVDCPAGHLRTALRETLQGLSAADITWRLSPARPGRGH